MQLIDNLMIILGIPWCFISIVFLNKGNAPLFLAPFRNSVLHFFLKKYSSWELIDLTFSLYSRTDYETGF